MSINAYKELTSRSELYGLLKESLDDVAEGNTKSSSETMSKIENQRKR